MGGGQGGGRTPVLVAWRCSQLLQRCRQARRVSRAPTPSLLQVVDGMDVVRAIESTPTGPMDRPRQARLRAAPRHHGSGRWARCGALLNAVLRAEPFWLPLLLQAVTIADAGELA